MADEEQTEDENEEGSVGGKKKLIIIIIAVLVLAGAGAGVFFSGILGKKSDDAELPKIEGATKSGAKGDGKVVQGPVYVELPDFLVNLNTAGTKVSFLRMKVTLELHKSEDMHIVEAARPRIVDSCLTYLRELRKSDLQGSAGVHRLREELLLRINKAIEPTQVKDILFGEFIVQ